MRGRRRSSSSASASCGTASGTATVKATATGGAGGAGAAGGTSGFGGNATALSTGTAGGNAAVTATATGGAGGLGALINTQGAGGNASATATGVTTGAAAPASPGIVTATATGGIGGAGLSQGTANANASATGRSVRANANATGGADTLHAAATTSGGAVSNATASTDATGGGAMTAAGSAIDQGSPLAATLGVNSDFATIVTRPDAIFVSTLLAQPANAAINTVLGGPSATILGYGAQGGAGLAGANGAQTLSSSEQFTLNASGLSGHLAVGLVGSQVLGSGFSSLSFTATVGGVTVMNQSFATAAAAQAFFANQVLDLGAFQHVDGLIVSLGLTLTTSTAGDGFSEAFLLGTSNAAVVCFAVGSRILTTRGELPVEAIAQGDIVVTGAGAHRPVTWVGHRRIDLARHPQPNRAAPVRIRRDAVADGLPARDLYLSPDHCLLLDGRLIPAKLLINFMTITHECERDSVAYYHIELDRHDVLLAEGLPVESYLDTGNRAFFANAGLPLVLHPAFLVNAGQEVWDRRACAPLAIDGATVAPVSHRLAERARALGYAPPVHETTDDPALRLYVDGRVLQPVTNDRRRYLFVLPAGASDVRLRSRGTVPSELVPHLDDWRRLGVAVRRIELRAGGDVMEIPVDHLRLTGGWHEVETDGATTWRWTNGDAVLPLPAAGRPAVLEVEVGMTTTHLIRAEMPDSRRRAA